MAAEGNHRGQRRIAGRVRVVATRVPYHQALSIRMTSVPIAWKILHSRSNNLIAPWFAGRSCTRSFSSRVSRPVDKKTRATNSHSHTKAFRKAPHVPILTVTRDAGINLESTGCWSVVERGRKETSELVEWIFSRVNRWTGQTHQFVVSGRSIRAIRVLKWS